MILIAVVIILLIAIPIVLGDMILYNYNGELSDSIVFRFLIGFFSLVSIWSLLAYPFTIFFAKYPFHLLINLFIIIISCFVVCWGFLCVKKRHGSYLLNVFTHNLNDFFRNKEGILYFVVFACIVLYQVLRIIIGSRYEFSDDKTYIPMINDMIYMDQVYAKEVSGKERFEIFESASWMPMEPWYEFLAFFSIVSRQAPLFICKTVMPVYLLLVMYLTLLVVYKTYSC